MVVDSSYVRGHRDPACRRAERTLEPCPGALATIAGLTPLALGIGAGAQIQRPLAVAVIGGLAVSTAVSLLILPALVHLASRISAPESKSS
jgi:Cu/Ag efflux pump CusA